MIIPKKDAKEYGAVHIDNYLSFIGFCKKVDSNEPCDVKVYLDGKLIDTITANKHIPKVEKIYDIANHSFIFELDEKHFDKSHLLEFKTNNDELLVNGSINTIDKQNPKFNEYRFLHSLSNIDENKIKDLYCKDAIGFLAVEGTLLDDSFVQYIKELYEKFPQVKIKAFYFNDTDYKLIKEKFSDEFSSFQLIIPSNMQDILQEIELFITVYETPISNIQYIKMSLQSIFKKTVTNAYMFGYTAKIKNQLVQHEKPEYEHRYFTNNKKFNFTDDEVKTADGNITKLIFNNLYKIAQEDKHILDTDNLHELYYFERIRLFFKNKHIKLQLINNYK